MRAYQAYLVDRKVSWGALNQTVCALRFFYGVTLGWKTDLPERIAYARTPRKLPVVLSADEVVGFLQAGEGDKEPGRFDDHLCGGLARLGSDAPEGD